MIDVFVQRRRRADLMVLGVLSYGDATLMSISHETGMLAGRTTESVDRLVNKGAIRKIRITQVFKDGVWIGPAKTPKIVYGLVKRD